MMTVPGFAGPVSDYKTLREKIAVDDAKGQLQLALWCQKNRLPVLSRKHLLRTIELDPDNSTAHKYLKHVKVGDTWFELKEAKLEKNKLTFSKKKTKAAPEDIKAWLTLAAYAEKNKLKSEAMECYLSILVMDAENKKARLGLEQLQLDGTWTERSDWEKRYADIEDDIERKTFFDTLRAAGFKGRQEALDARRRMLLSRRGSHKELKLQDTDAFPTGQYILVTPSTIDIDKVYPLLIALHGGGPNVGQGSDIIGFYQSGCKKDGYILAVPDSLSHNHASEWNTDAADDYIVALIEELRRDYPIDERRIYLSGVSMGGAGCWKIGSNHPEIFAGLAPMCAPCFDTKLANCRDMVLYFVHGDQDAAVSVENSRQAAATLESKGFDFTYLELAGVGHDIPTKHIEPLFDFFKHWKHLHPGKAK